MTYVRKEIIGDCTLYQADCADVMPTLGRFDACITDPPYGLGIASNPVRQAHGKKNWDDKTPQQSVFNKIRAISEQQIIWGGNYFNLPASQCFLIWDKMQPYKFSLAMCEMAWCSKSSPAKMFRQSVTSYEKSHPTQKPVNLMRWCLEQIPDAKTIFDPFMGSGTTGVACVQAGLSFTGIERDAEYFDIACKRIEAAYAQPDLFIAPAEKKENAILPF